MWLVIPLVLTEWWLRKAWPDTRNLVTDWYNFVFYGLFMLYGFYLSLHDHFWARVSRNRRGYLAGGVLAFAVIYWGWHSPGEGFLETTTAGWLIFSFFKCLNIWCWIVCFIGFSYVYLNQGNAFLQYTNEAVYPFYILHQTVLIGIGYYVIQGSFSIALKYSLIVVGTFVGTFLLYEYVLRRLPLLRLFFGLKPRLSAKTVVIPSS